jgi:5S rRNA maturation endonuclease (ribonuclease M5)
MMVLNKRLTNQQILAVSNQLSTRVEDLLKYFEIDYIEYPNRLAFPCPIHGGDNPEGCSIFTDGVSSKGNWNCWTANCHEDYGKNTFGFVRGLLTNRKAREVGVLETFYFCSKFLGLDPETIEFEQPVENYSVVKILEVFQREPVRHEQSVDRETIVDKLDIPSKYYIDRGYKSETLEKFDIGMCIGRGKPMSGRVVVPIYDENNKYVACIGRAVYQNMKPKWLHSKGFKKSSYLYGYNVAKDDIMKKGTIVLVEGQGDVWRMHEAGVTNTVGIFGASLSEDQLILIERSGARNVVILTDYDEAGQKAAKQILKRCGRRFNYYRPEIDQKDVGDMTVEQIQDQIINKLQGVL